MIAQGAGQPLDPSGRLAEHGDGAFQDQFLIHLVFKEDDAPRSRRHSSWLICTSSMTSETAKPYFRPLRQELRGPLSNLSIRQLHHAISEHSRVSAWQKPWRIHYVEPIRALYSLAERAELFVRGDRRIGISHPSFCKNPRGHIGIASVSRFGRVLLVARRWVMEEARGFSAWQMSKYWPSPVSR